MAAHDDEHPRDDGVEANTRRIEASVVTDFSDGSDKIDLRALYQASGYTGANAVADRYVSFESDGAGGTKVMYDTDGAGSGQAWSYHISTLQGVAETSLSNADLVGGSTGGEQTQPGGGETSYEELKRRRDQQLDRVSAYLARARAYGKTDPKTRQTDWMLEALVPLVEKRTKLYTRVGSYMDFKDAIAYGEKEGVDMVIITSPFAAAMLKFCWLLPSQPM